MFSTTLYFVFSYAIILCAIFSGLALLKRWKVSRLANTAFKILSFSLLCVPFIPYAVVAAQTSTHKKEMLAEVCEALTSMGMQSDDIITFRVLSIDSSQAEVYIVQPCGVLKDRNHLRSATLFYFKRTAKGWNFDTYDSPWSECGSAQGNTFPPYLDANDF